MKAKYKKVRELKNNTSLPRIGLPLLYVITLFIGSCTSRGNVQDVTSGDNKYLYYAQRSIDSLLANAQDRYGNEHSGMIISILNCKNAEPLRIEDLTGPDSSRYETVTYEDTIVLPKPPFGVRKSDRTGLGGSNTNLQQDLYRAMEHLGRISKTPRYELEAHRAMEDFLRITQHPETGLLAWGEHLYWHCLEDRLGDDLDKNRTHEPKRKFIYFDYLYSVDTARSLKYARGLWDHQIADKVTGDFSRHARYGYHHPGRGGDFPKEGSYFIDTWAKAYEKTKDPEYLKAITAVASRFLNRTNNLGLLDFDSSGVPDRVNWCVTLPLMSLAIELDNAAKLVDDTTAVLLRTLVKKVDKGVLSLKHDAQNPEKGFICYAYTDSGEPRPLERKQSNGYSRHWGMGYGIKTTSMYGIMAYSRLWQLEEGEKADAYRNMVLEAAKAYQKILPDPVNNDIWAVEYGMAILLEIAAYRLTADDAFLATAQNYADEAIKVFWKDGEYAIPTASSLTNYHDCISCPDTLILALLALYEHTSGLSPKVEISDINR